MKPKPLELENKWYDDGLQLAKWSDSSKKILKKAFLCLREKLILRLGAYCMNLKGRGGLKGSVRCIYNKLDNHPYVARFDIKSFYGSIDHKILFQLLEKMNVNPELMNVIREYVVIPDTRATGKGIVAGGALSSLLGAVYLSPLDTAMNKLYKKASIFYLRYVDDIVILAKTRWKFKEAVKLMHETLDSLLLEVHKDKKRFVGKTKNGFDFLGFFFKSNRKVRPSRNSLERFAQRARQLMEQGDLNNLLSYVERFYNYIHAGLQNSVIRKGIRKYLRFIDYKLEKKLTEKITLLC
jgi:RNA-directed DNA polymerase